MGLLNIGASALNAAQIGLSTTGHNIANANTPGYSRQVVETSAAGAQQTGNGFLGKGAEVSSIRRVYDQFLTEQVRTAQSTDSQLSAYKSKIDDLNNILANPVAGISPVMQDFFAGIQNVTNEAGSAAARQTVISGGEAMAARFQSISAQVRDVRQSINGEIANSVGDINVQVAKIATLNKAITAVDNVSGKPPNDLLDQRDQAVAELSKQIKVAVVQEGSNYNVFMGTGQTLVTGANAAKLYTMPSANDPEKLDVGYISAAGKTAPIGEKVLTGGVLGGLMDFRSSTLVQTENSLGRLGIAIGTQINAQHAMGVTPNGEAGGKFFDVAEPVVKVNRNNAGSGDASATITDVSKLTTSDYQLEYRDTPAPAYRLTRLSDGSAVDFEPPASGHIAMDGLDIKITGAAANGDRFLIQPTINGAKGLSMAIRSGSDIAAAGTTNIVPSTANAGNASIGPITNGSSSLAKGPVELIYSPDGTLSGFPKDVPVTVTNSAGSITYPANTAVPYQSGETLDFDGMKAVIEDVEAPPSPKFAVAAQPSILSYSARDNTLTGFPIPLTVTVTTDKGATVYAPGMPVPYTPGAVMTFGGIAFSMTGTPKDGDTFNVEKASGAGDNRNALALGQLQAAAILDNKSTSFQGGYAEMVSAVGSKSSEINATSQAAANVLSVARTGQQEVSGVNLDEEAANLMHYQQMYQAAGKVMQTAQTMFQTLLTIGG